MESGWGTSSGCFALRTDLPRHTGPELAAGRRKIRRRGRRWRGEPIGRPAARGSSTTTSGCRPKGSWSIPPTRRRGPAASSGSPCPAPGHRTVWTGSFRASDPVLEPDSHGKALGRGGAGQDPTQRGAPNGALRAALLDPACPAGATEGTGARTDHHNDRAGLAGGATRHGRSLRNLVRESDGSDGPGSHSSIAHANWRRSAAAVTVTGRVLAPPASAEAVRVPARDARGWRRNVGELSDGRVHAGTLHPDRDVPIRVPPLGLPPAGREHVLELAGRTLAQPLGPGFLQIQAVVPHFVVLGHVHPSSDGVGCLGSVVLMPCGASDDTAASVSRGRRRIRSAPARPSYRRARTRRPA